MTVPANNEPTISTEIIFEGRIIRVRVDTVQLVNGRTSTREIAEHSPSVCVVPVDADGNVLLVRQYRKPAEAFLLEVPAGGIETGEDPDVATLRELQEEIGYTAGNLLRLTGFWLAPGWCTEYMYAYLATNLTPARLESDDDEFIDVVRVPLAQSPDLIANGTIQDAKSVASLLLAMRVLGTST
jgi:ADP-ribose pyrophosphatase